MEIGNSSYKLDEVEEEDDLGNGCSGPWVLFWILVGIAMWLGIGYLISQKIHVL